MARAARLRGAVEKLRDGGEFIHSSRDGLAAERFEPPLIEALGAGRWRREKAAGAVLSLVGLARELVAG